MEGVLLRPNCGIYSGNGDGNGGGGRVYGTRFSNNDHLQYYQDSNRWRSQYSTVGVRCGVVVVAGGCNKDSVMYKETTTTKTLTTDDKKKRNNMKKRLKLAKGLSNDLAMLLSSGGADGFLLDHQGLREASEVLLSQLKKLQSEQKELKKKMKEEKAKCKAAADCTSTTSSSSSESSDSECETEVLNMNRPKCEKYALPPSMTINGDGLQPQQLAPVIQHKEAQISASLTSTWNQERPVTPPAAAVVEDYNLQISEQDNNDVLLSSLLEKDVEKDMEKKKIEVCMGGKCKKSGAGALLEEFQKFVGPVAPAVDVVGCKCMGKCRDGPNVRLVSSSSSSLPNGSYVDDELPHHHHQVAVAAATAAVAVASSSSVVTRRTPKPSYPLCIGVGLEDVGAIVSKLTGDRFPQ